MGVTQSGQKEVNEPRTTVLRTNRVTSRPKKALIIYAHPEPKSFNGAMKDAAAAALNDAGYDVEISDLYAMRFNPVSGPGDVVGGLTNPEFYRQGFESGVAYSKGSLAADITEEIEKIRRAELLVFQFPMHWMSVPAILKGWFDRVLVYGFAYGNGQWYSDGLLKGKRALLSLTTASPSSMYSSAGITGDINVILWPLQSGVLRFCGLDVLPPQVTYAVPYVDEETRKNALDKWRQRLASIDTEQPLPFGDVALFDAAGGYLLKDEARAEQASNTHGMSVGTHLGKPLPSYPVYPL